MPPLAFYKVLISSQEIININNMKDNLFNLYAKLSLSGRLENPKRYLRYFKSPYELYKKPFSYIELTNPKEAFKLKIEHYENMLFELINIWKESKSIKEDFIATFFNRYEKWEKGDYFQLTLYNMYNKKRKEFIKKMNKLNHE